MQQELSEGLPEHYNSVIWRLQILLHITIQDAINCMPPRNNPQYFFT